MANLITILGAAPNATNVALRKVLKNGECSGPLIIIDYTGRGAIILKESNKMSIRRHPVEWVDLSDRRKPVALFQLERTDHFQSILLRVLRLIGSVAGIRIKDSSLDWAVKAGYGLSNNGTVGLNALLKFGNSIEARRWFLDTRCDPEDIDKLTKMLSWALSYASVYAISEAINKISYSSFINRGGTLWIEMKTEHFEPYEHRIVGCLAEAAVENICLSFNDTPPQKRQRNSLTVVHLFPLSQNVHQVEKWVTETSHRIKHISVNKMEGSHALHPLTLSWLGLSDQTWVVGELGEIDDEKHSIWLNQTELQRLKELSNGEVWVRSKDADRHLVARTIRFEGNMAVDQQLRTNSSKRRKMMPIGQMSTAASKNAGNAEGAYALYKKICDFDLLYLAWLKVKKGKKSSCGVDGVTIGTFEKNVTRDLNDLAHDLKTQVYRCNPLRRFYIPKPDGGQRSLGILCTRDKIVQTACLMTIEPIFEAGFSPYSFGFRPNRSALQAISLARNYMAAGRTWAVIADIKDCFDSIDHEVLFDLVSKQVKDADILDLLRHFISIEVLYFRELLPIITGVPQGESISPLMSNIYLDPLDKHFERMDFKFVRFADDITLFMENEDRAIDALNSMREFLNDPLHLELKPAKTAYVSAYKSFDFLGFTMDPNEIRASEKKCEAVENLVSEKLKTLGDSVATPLSCAQIIQEINSIVRGFRNYFFIENEPRIKQQMTLLDGKVDELSNRYLPSQIRDDPIWICREKFGATANVDNRHYNHLNAQTQCLTQMKLTIKNSVRGHLEGKRLPSPITRNTFLMQYLTK